MTLRRRLVAVQLLLVTVGLAAFGVVSYTLYSRSQYQRVDAQLESVAPVLGRFAGRHLPGAPTFPFDQDDPEAARGTALPSGSYVELLSTSGTVLAPGQSIACLYGDCSKPVLPAHMSPGTGPSGRLFTVSSTDGSTSFRVLVRTEDPFGGPPQGAETPGSTPASASPEVTGDDVLVAAIPLDDVTKSLHRLIIVDLAVGAAVLLALSAAGLLVVRRGLRPLERMSATARAIARGDLSRRASPADGRSEVGQLGAAFNAMMGNIEGAFAERDATEERLRQFLADASHELRTPLTSIRGYAELYRMGAAASPAELEVVMDRIETHAKEMGGLVEELLLLARMDETRPPDRVDVDVAVVAAECCSDLVVTDPTRRLTLDAPEPVHVVGDPVHLRQAIGNLLTNARRHTPAGSPIEVAVAQAGGVAVITVRDHGAGLNPEGLARAFDRFWRADSSRRGSGAGLGLAIVAAVAAEHGGAAAVANAAGGGAQFTIRLPLAAGAARPVDPLRPLPPAPVAQPAAPDALAGAAPEEPITVGMAQGSGPESQPGPMPSPADSEERPPD